MKRDFQNETREKQHEPNLFDFVPKNVWREVYNGRWSTLTRVQKIEFAVEVIFFVVFTASLAFHEYVVGGQLLGFVIAFSGIAVVLVLFFLLLTRFIR